MDSPFLTESLSDEILLIILKNLDLESVINLSQTCRKFDNLIKDKTICKELHYKWFYRLDRLTFVKFLRNCDRAPVITKLNLNDLYWIPSGVIRDITRPLVNLKELHLAGTQVCWNHLVQILTSSPTFTLTALSWSWDNRIESLTNRVGLARLVPNIPNPTDVETIKAHLERLAFLFIHIPMVQNPHSTSYTLHPGLSYFVSLCKNLEHLWIVSWPKTEAERKLIEIFGEEHLVECVNFPKLKTFTLRAQQSFRLYSPKLVHAIVNNLEKNGNGSQLTHLWLDHPLLSGSWISYHSVDRISGSFSQTSHLWPKLKLKSVERLSLPLIEKSVDWLTGNSFEKVKFLQITDGLPRIVNLNGLFDMATDLESITMKAINIKLDWNRFVDTHPKLCEVNLCQDDHFPYPDICQALTKLGPNLKRLGLPLFALIEIKNSSIIKDYQSVLEPNDTALLKNVSSRIETTSTEFGKKKRIAMVNRHQGPSESISGISILTQACPNVEEFELGFVTITRPGTLIINSLVNVSKWKNLVKLTIENAPIYDGQFLIQIAQNCKLRSLRLKNLGNRARCTYTNDLCTALTMLDELRDFRLEQNYIGSTSKVISSLQHCSKLRRLLLWSQMNDYPLDHESCVTLMATCNDLMMLYLTVGPTTKHACDLIRKAIESQHRKTRPALSVIIRRGHDMVEDALPVIYPSVHYRQMVGFYPQIGQQSHFDVH